MASWFFFSYARDDQDEYLDKFYADLLKEISLVKTTAAVGFLDQGDIRIGDQWAEKLTEELRTCKVFVSICTPNYFDRPYCGKEFQICLDRLASSKKTSTAMVSVIWGDPSGSVHPSMKRFQYTHKSLPAKYAENGLRYLMKVGLYKDDYGQFITSLAKAIVHAGTNYPLPEPAALDPIGQVKNAFGKAVKQAASASNAIQRNANFSYVVGSSDEICDIPKRLLRDLPSRYGPGGREWRPFYPEYEDSVGDVAMLATAMQKLYYKELPPLENLLDRIQEAEAKKEIVVLLVDPWTIRVKTYRKLMEQYDRRNFLNCAVLVAWNSLLKTKRQRKKFEDEIADTFKFRANQYQKSVYYVDSISTDDDLRATLARTLTELRSNLIQRSDEQQRIKQPRFNKSARRQGIELSRKPIVIGPGKRR